MPLHFAFLPPEPDADGFHVAEHITAARTSAAEAQSLIDLGFAFLLVDYGEWAHAELDGPSRPAEWLFRGIGTDGTDYGSQLDDRISAITTPDLQRLDAMRESGEATDTFDSLDLGCYVAEASAWLATAVARNSA